MLNQLLTTAAVTPHDWGFGWALLRMLVVLLGIVGLAWCVLRFGLPRLTGRASSQRTIQLIDSFTLAQHRHLWLVRVGERHFLLGSGERSIELLTELDLPAPSDRQMSATARSSANTSA